MSYGFSFVPMSLCLVSDVVQLTNLDIYRLNADLFYSIQYARLS